MGHILVFFPYAVFCKIVASGDDVRITYIKYIQEITVPELPLSRYVQAQQISNSRSQTQPRE